MYVTQVNKATSVVVMNCAEIEIQSAKCATGDLGEYVLPHLLLVGVACVLVNHQDACTVRT